MKLIIQFLHLPIASSLSSYLACTLLFGILMPLTFCSLLWAYWG